MGNIIAWTQDDVTVTYEYDIVGQLIRVNDPTDPTSGNGTSWRFEYDRGGNILNKKRYAYTVSTLGPVLQTITYGYDTTWKDKLVSYNGATITYDAIGNPLSDGTWTYVWENGRQLKQMSTSGTTVSFQYNHEGLRVKKTVNNIVTDYTLHGTNIVHLVQGNDKLHFFYDASNKPAIVEFNGTKYAYVQDLQGDICQIIDANGAVVVEYTYDAWGKVLNVTGSMAGTLGKIQPFRYRGYVYDVETGLYYLKNRYYNPETGRFLNADVLIISNSFSYCSQNPVNYCDLNGTIEDYTNYINNTIKEALPSFRANIILHPYEKPSVMMVLEDIDSYLWFMEQVNDKARWDVKNPESWKEVFPDLPTPDFKEKFIFRNMEITGEDLGNILYGYFGSAMGINDVMLYAAAGVAQQLGHVNMDTYDDFFLVLDTFVECYCSPEKYYGDEKNDHINICIGIGMYFDDFR